MDLWIDGIYGSMGITDLWELRIEAASGPLLRDRRSGPIVLSAADKKQPPTENRRGLLSRLSDAASGARSDESFGAYSDQSFMTPPLEAFVTMAE